MKKQKLRPDVPESGWLRIHSQKCGRDVGDDDMDIELAKNDLEPLLEHLKDTLFAHGYVNVNRCNGQRTLTAHFPAFPDDGEIVQKILDGYARKL